MTEQAEGPSEETGAVLSFWFEELGPEEWFSDDPGVEETIRERFTDLYHRVADGLAGEWEKSIQGALAAVLVLHQFPRRLFPEDPRAFATDDRALAIARQALDRGFQTALSPLHRLFLFLPFLDSEDPEDQARSVELFATLDDPQLREAAERHQAIIGRFGRFPQRNGLLGRETTEEERAFLEDPEAFF